MVLIRTNLTITQVRKVRFMNIKNINQLRI